MITWELTKIWKRMLILYRNQTQSGLLHNHREQLFIHKRTTNSQDSLMCVKWPTHIC